MYIFRLQNLIEYFSLLCPNCKILNVFFCVKRCICYDKIHPLLINSKQEILTYENRVNYNIKIETCLIESKLKVLTTFLKILCFDKIFV